MPLIHLTTFITAPLDRVFKLSLSVDLHKYSMKHYDERIVDGVMSGLMKLHDTVTWRAKHLFRERRMTVKITSLEAPHLFTDEQQQGPFQLMKHEHYFKEVENGTIMIDQFRFNSKGFAGKLFDQLYIEKYLKKLLTERNAAIKHAAETTQWKQFLNA